MKKQLPKNWVECSLGEIAEWGSGGTPNRGIPSYYNGTIPWLKTGDLNDGLITEVKEFITDLGLKNSSAKIFPKNSVVIAMYGATIGKTGILNFDSSTNQACAVAVPYFNMNKFIYLFLKSEKENFIEKGKGGAQPNISQAVIKSHRINLPPLPEQNRIVAKIDVLFAQLETIKTSMAKVPLLLKDFRQQVLKQAVTGKLTNKNDIISVSLSSTITIGSLFEEAPLNWKWVKLIDIAKLESGHTPRKSEEEYWINGNVPWISLQDIRAAHGKIINETKYMPNELGIKKSSARLLPKGTVCFCRDISVGYTTVMGKEMSTTQHFANWICGNSLNNMFLLYVFMSAKDFLIASGKGTTVGTIYMPALKELRILLPPLEEQLQIVRRVEKLFAKADAIEHQYKTLKAKIDTLPQAILHKAFKGELSDQLDTDGDARELLEEIKALKYATGKVLKSKTTKKATKKVKSYPENDEVLGMVAEP